MMIIECLRKPTVMTSTEISSQKEARKWPEYQRGSAYKHKHKQSSDSVHKVQMSQTELLPALFLGQMSKQNFLLEKNIYT